MNIAGNSSLHLSVIQIKTMAGRQYAKDDIVFQNSAIHNDRVNVGSQNLIHVSDTASMLSFFCSGLTISTVRATACIDQAEWLIRP